MKINKKLRIFLIFLISGGIHLLLSYFFIAAEYGRTMYNFDHGTELIHQSLLSKIMLGFLLFPNNLIERLGFSMDIYILSTIFYAMISALIVEFILNYTGKNHIQTK